MKLVALIFALTMPISSFAQDQQIPKPVLDDLARDLSQLNQVVLKARGLQNTQALSSSQAGPGVDVIKITNASTDVHAGATSRSDAIDRVLKGDTFPVIDKAGDWYAVKLPKPAEGLNTGWVKAADAVPYSTANWGAVGQVAGVIVDPVLVELTTLAANMKQKWAKNEYISITGFSISFVPPDLSLTFNFKQP